MANFKYLGTTLKNRKRIPKKKKE